MRLHPNVKIDDRLWRELLAKAHELDKAHARVGVLGSKAEQTHGEAGDITMVELMAIHELGSPAANIPERRPIRKTFEVKSQALAEFSEKLAREIVTKGMPVPRALGLLGTWGATQVKKTITEDEHLEPPLTAETVARKGSDRPLVDTGRLVGAISYEVSMTDDE